MSHLDRGLNTIHVVGIGPEDAIGLALRDAFENVLLFSGNSSTHTPSLFVDIRTNEILIGPLTLSNRAGCWRCAFERMSAARASEPAAEQNALLSRDEISKKITPVLIREIQAINAEGLEQSPLLDHVLVVDLSTLDESLHKVIPLARCDVCGGAAAFPYIAQEQLRLSPEDSPELVLGALAGWVDRRTGIISDLFIEPPHDPRVSLPIIATAAPPHVMEKDGSLHRLPAGWGKGLTVSGAVLSAVGEAIERYSASVIDPEKIVWKRPDEFEGEVMDPRDLGLYSDAQYDRDDFSCVRFDSSIPHPWVLGSWLNDGKLVWLPAILVFLSIELHREQLIVRGTSNGLAASTEKDDAALRAILELVERDAFMSTWLTSRPAQRIQLDDTLDPMLSVVLEGIEALGATVEVYRLPASVIGTTVLCLALGDGDEYPGVTFGLGSDLDPRVALRQAVLELGQTGPYLRRMMQSGILKAAEDPAGVREMMDHAAYYFPKERATAFDRLRGQDTVSLRELKSVAKRSLAECAAALDEAGVRVALVDVTSADVATGPFTVMRAVSPDLQPIWFGYGLERIHKLKVADDVPPINPIW
jgi:ribosomal protein S12 methylthiotransferase accessory factor